MPTIMPQSELLRRAVEFVAESRNDRPDKKLDAILDEAAMRFNLSPLDAAAVQRLFSSAPDGTPGGPGGPGAD